MKNNKILHHFSCYFNCRFVSRFVSDTGIHTHIDALCCIHSMMMRLDIHTYIYLQKEKTRTWCYITFIVYIYIVILVIRQLVDEELWMNNNNKFFLCPLKKNFTQSVKPTFSHPPESRQRDVKKYIYHSFYYFSLPYLITHIYIYSGMKAETIYRLDVAGLSDRD